jgi:hypothetical protein
MNKKRFVVCFILGAILFFTRVKLGAPIEQMNINGFHQFLLKGLFFVPAVLLLFSSIFSLMASGVYLIARGDPELKIMARNMFYFFIWKELLNEK